jgi:hypothetical protein
MPEEYLDQSVLNLLYAHLTGADLNQRAVVAKVIKTAPLSTEWIIFKEDGKSPPNDHINLHRAKKKAKKLIS